MGVKQVTYLVNGEKIRVNVEKREVTGPEHLMTIIREANERLKGNEVTCKDGYMNMPPGELWQTRSLFPLLKYIFGEENVSWDRSEPTIYYENNSPHEKVY